MGESAIQLKLETDKAPDWDLDAFWLEAAVERTSCCIDAVLGEIDRPQRLGLDC